MRRLPVFFLMMTFLAVGLVGLAALPLLKTEGQPVTGRQTNLGWVVEGTELAQLRPAPGFPVMPPPGPRQDLEGVRMTATSALAPDARYSKGVRLMLSDALASHIQAGATGVRVIVRANARPPAQSMAVGLVTEGPVKWVSHPVTATFTTIEFALPNPAQKPRALAIWPGIEGNESGVEIKAIIFTQPTPAAPQSPSPPPADPAASPPT